MATLQQLQHNISTTDRLMDGIIEALVDIREREGQEGFRHDYDKAVHIRVAIDKAGLKIVNKPKGKGQ